MTEPQRNIPIWLRAISAVALIAVAYLAIAQGLRLRQWLYASSGEHGIRFHGDIESAWRQGRDVLNIARQQRGARGPATFPQLLRAYLVRYDEAVQESGDNETYSVDYPPARLLIISIWVWDTTRHATGRIGPPEDVDGPLLKLNTGCELAGAIAAFFVVRLVLRRQGNRFANWAAMLAATLLWFDAALLIDAHVWPQWEAWLVPFYLFAALSALARRWLLCGAFLGFGMMFKGQILITMVLFAAWPLLQMRWRAAAEVACASLATAMLLVVPWMFQTTGSAIFFTEAALCACIGLRWVPRGWRLFYTIAWIGPAIFISGARFGGSFAWWKVGLEFGSYHYLSLTMGPTNNLAIILDRFNWQLLDAPFTMNILPLHEHVLLTNRTLLASIYFVALAICAIGIARHDARGDRRVLIALATPWVVMFAFMPQMHDRYLVWGAAITALAAGVCLGTTVLHLLVTFLACLPLCANLLNFNPRDQHGFPYWWTFLRVAGANTALVTVLAALMLLYLSVAPTKRRGFSLPARDPR